MYYFVSENPSVATVNSSGVVTGVSVGETVIKIYFDNAHTDYYGQVNITIYEPDSPSTVPATGITLNKTSLKLKYAYNFSARLKATVTPANATDKTVIWTSSDPTALSVKDGYVKCLQTKEGNFTITASTRNGNTAICPVTITKNGTYVDSVVPSTWDVETHEKTQKEFRVYTTNADGYDSGYTVYDPAGYTRVVKRGDGSITLEISENKSTARSFDVYLHGNFNDDDTTTIHVTQPYNPNVIGFANSSLHKTYGYDKDGNPIITGEVVDTTYFLKDQDSLQYPGWGNAYHHEYDNEGHLISGSSIIYINCMQAAFNSIYQNTTVSDPWIKIVSHQYRGDVGGMIGIMVETNTTGKSRPGSVDFPGGFSYPIIQEG